MSKVLLLALLVSNSCGADFIYKPGPVVPASQGQIWPKPQHEDQLDGSYFSLLPSFFQFKSTGNTCSILKEGLDRYRNIILFNNRLIKQIYFKVRTCEESSDQKFLGFLSSLEVELTGSCDDDEFPTVDMNEEYVLNVTSDVQKLSSGSVWGVLRGLETFSQLVYLSDDYSCHRVRTTSIHDYPRFPYRGLMLDTSRHYQPKELILKLLDAMAYNKFNVFRWHIVDENSFPYVSTTFPELSEKGAFHPSLMVYDQTFVAEVQEYARKRGIRVVAEFDTPGHTLAWGLGNPDLLTRCYDVPMLEWGPIDPTKNSTYTFIFKLFEEINEVFKDEYIHLGGDEVDFSCWKSNPDINDFMKEQGMEGDYQALQSYYFQRLIDHIASLGLAPMVWEEVFTNGVEMPKSTIVEVWTSDDPKGVLANVTAEGHPAIVSAYWYLNLQSPGGDWARFYNVDLLDFPGDDEQKKLVLGGEACMWAEVVNEYNLESRTWPRACAPAEKLWSEAQPIRTELRDQLPVAERLQEQTCRMNRRGIGAQPPTAPSVCF